MLNCRFTPIQKWPGQPTSSHQRTRGAFKAGWSNTLDLLERELNQLRAKEITVEGFFSRDQIRNDGWPKSSARPTQPGVVLSFDTNKGRMVIPCDKYLGWESNLRAIALTLEHLRAVERYGATYHGEQYTGWLKLPAASATDEAMQHALTLIQFADRGYLSKDDAATAILDKPASFDLEWREAVRQTHPDTGGGAGAGKGGRREAMKTQHHIHMSIQGALNQHPHDFQQSFQGVVTNDEGRVISPDEFRRELLDLQAKGHKLFPMSSDCEGFDPFGKGCPGHPIYEWTQA